MKADKRDPTSASAISLGAHLDSSNLSLANGSAVNISEIDGSGSTLDQSESKDTGARLKKETKTVNIKIDKVDVETFMKTDWRHFECKTWHLEPTVRLLSWAGKSIEPYGIDYILNKLGFSHARTTIPKWLQRGFMDPLDKVEAFLMFQLLLMVKENGDGDSKAKH